MSNIRTVWEETRGSSSQTRPASATRYSFLRHAPAQPSDAAVDAVRHIGQVIMKINDHSTTIASAVEEQTATTGEIGRNVAEAALGSTNIAENITGVAEASMATSQAATEASTTTQTISGVVGALTATVERFRY